MTFLSIGHNSSVVPAPARNWTQILLNYRRPSHARSIAELAATVGPLVGLWAAAAVASSLGFWWASLLIAIPAGGFMVRLFVIQHDCGHGSFFRHKWANDWVGRVLGVFTLTPYDWWRRTHAIHHSTSANLDKRGIGDVDTLTVREFFALSWWGRLKYRFYRNPVVMFGIAPAFLFFLQHRLPVGLMRSGWLPWVSTQATNAAILAIAGGLIWLVGVKAFFLVHLPIMLIAATLGVWLFYVQHQFEGTVWVENKEWDFHEAALNGSSFYDLPFILRWITANIGIHHVHHLCSNIPYYRLPGVLRDHPDLKRIGRLTLRGSLACPRLALWDEERQRLIPFSALRGRKA